MSCDWISTSASAQNSRSIDRRRRVSGVRSPRRRQSQGRAMCGQPSDGASSDARRHRWRSRPVHRTSTDGLRTRSRKRRTTPIRMRVRRSHPIASERRALRGSSRPQPPARRRQRRREPARPAAASSGPRAQRPPTTPRPWPNGRSGTMARDSPRPGRTSAGHGRGRPLIALTSTTSPSTVVMRNAGIHRLGIRRYSITETSAIVKMAVYVPARSLTARNPSVERGDLWSNSHWPRLLSISTREPFVLIR